MNRAEESAFVWALMDSANPFLSKTARTWLCVRIGAGELESAIKQLLRGFVASETALPANLMESLAAWISGFAGSEGEADLRELMCGINMSPPPSHLADPGPVRLKAVRLVPRRSARAAGRELQAVQS
ncbi:hypothetical protein A5784_03745 [Mycobacterium sp. 852013-50091_SCH5140682]|nr:hypothetical protein A5784_03745 [Mycobacterium sp. 852013-50091_SCH5140682]